MTVLADHEPALDKHAERRRHDARCLAGLDNDVQALGACVRHHVALDKGAVRGVQPTYHAFGRGGAFSFRVPHSIRERHPWLLEARFAAAAASSAPPH